jgi:hypothetical protein
LLMLYVASARAAEKHPRFYLFFRINPIRYLSVTPLPLECTCPELFHTVSLSQRRSLMEYYIVRIYRREPGRTIDGYLHDIKVTGLVEDYTGHKESFHDAETLWQLLAQKGASIKTKGKEGKS